MWSQMAHPKYPLLSHIVGAIAPSLVLPNKEEREHIFPIWGPLKMILENSGYFHIQGEVGLLKLKLYVYSYEPHRKNVNEYWKPL